MLNANLNLDYKSSKKLANQKDKKMNRNLFSIMMLSLMLASKLVASQMVCKTPEGREVILDSNGKWSYADIKENRAVQNYTGMVESEIVPLGLKFDSKAWKKLNNKLNDDAEFSFMTNNGKGFAFMLNEEAEVDPEFIKEIIVDVLGENTKRQLIKEEDRVVNGIPIKYFEITIQKNKLLSRLMYYIYCGENATVQLVAFAAEKNFQKLKPQLEEFLNGLYKI